MSNFINLIEHAGRRIGRNNAFCDFLTFAVCALSMETAEDEYLRTTKRYSHDELVLFAQALGELVKDMDNRGEGLKDCLGDHFMEILSSERKGQFFTPQSLCDMMAAITGDYESGKTVSDPCCGSGRMLLSAAKINRDLMFWGCDIDLQCCQMTLINMCLNGLRGVVSHMDTLQNKEWRRWVIELHPIYFVPYIREIDLTCNFETASFSEFETVPVIKEPQKPQIKAVQTEMSFAFDDWI